MSNDLTRFPNFRLLSGPGHPALHEQIKNNLKHNISAGFYPPNSRLPSVRELAEYLKVAPNTVARVYQELQNEGLIVSKSALGTFVSDIILSADEVDHAPNDAAALEKILAPALAEAGKSGYSDKQIVEAIQLLLAQQGRTVGMVGINRNVVEKWVEILETEFADLRLRVIGLTLAEIEADATLLETMLARVHHVFAFISTFSEVRSLLRDTGKEVLALVVELSMRTHHELAEVPVNAQIALVCEERQANTFLGITASYCNPEQIQHVEPRNESELRRVLAESDYVLHTLMARDYVLPLISPDHKVIEFELLLNRDCFAHYRNVLMNGAGWRATSTSVQTIEPMAI